MNEEMQRYLRRRRIAFRLALLCAALSLLSAFLVQATLSLVFLLATVGCSVVFFQAPPQSRR